MAQPPQWQAHVTPGYDEAMRQACADLLAGILTSAARRQSILGDPRDLHRSLFSRFTPSGFDEYAGTYRGTPDTAVVSKASGALSQLKPGAEYPFVPPNEVASRMATLLTTTHNLMADPTDDWGRLLTLTYTFAWFGKVHPFLDGNGHVQRAIFAAMATEFGIPLSTRFQIHPRPFGQLLATALEIFASTPPGEENAVLPLVAEYLAFFLDGPFIEPRKNIAPGSLYE